VQTAPVLIFNYLKPPRCSFRPQFLSSQLPLTTWRVQERELIMEVWGCAPTGVQEQKPWSGELCPWSWKLFSGRMYLSKMIDYGSNGEIIQRYCHSTATFISPNMFHTQLFIMTWLENILLVNITTRESLHILRTSTMWLSNWNSLMNVKWQTAMML